MRAVEPSHATVHRTVAFRWDRSLHYHKVKERGGCLSLLLGAGDRDRTGTDFTPRDFKSLVSACSTTAAYYSLIVRSACRCPVAVPEISCSLLLTKFRPLPLARVAPSAAGGASLAPQFHHIHMCHHSTTHRSRCQCCVWKVSAVW